MRWILSLLFLVNTALAAPLRVAIIDTGLDLADPRFQDVLCESGHKDLTGTGIIDRDGHGTHIAGIIKATALDADYCLIIIKFWDSGQEKLDAAFAYVDKLDVDIVNISAGGEGPSNFERHTILRHRSVTFVAAAGNSGANLDAPDGPKFYPACYGYSNVEAVGNLDNGKPAENSNYGSVVRYWEEGTSVRSTVPGGKTAIMSGTSMAAARRTGRLIFQRGKR